MQASQKPVIWTTIVCSVVLLLVLIFAISQIPETPEINIPTAAEIAAAVTIPEVTIPEVDTTQQQEIWEGVYDDEIEDLKHDALDACEDEFDWDDIEDLFSKYVDVEFVKEYEDDREFEILNLGLDDEDDRHIIIMGILKVRLDDEDRELVHGTCEVTSDDGDLEAELSYHL